MILSVSCDKENAVFATITPEQCSYRILSTLVSRLINDVDVKKITNWALLPIFLNLRTAAYFIAVHYWTVKYILQYQFAQ